jgi:IPT/TIG domain
MHGGWRSRSDLEAMSVLPGPVPRQSDSAPRFVRLLAVGTVLAAGVFGVGVLGTAPSGAATRSGPPAASAGSVAPGVSGDLTDPTGGNHPYRHGAVPRIIRSSLRGARVAGPSVNGPASTSNPTSSQAGSAAPASGSLLRYGGGLTSGGLVSAGVTSGQPQVYLVFLGNQWGAESVAGSGVASFAHDPDHEAAALQTLYGGLGTHGELWSGIVTQYCDGAAVGATSCSSSTGAVPYPAGRVLAGVWHDSSAGATSAAATGATGHQLAAEAEAAAVHFGNSTQAANRDAQYVIASPTGSDADGWSSPVNGYCAYHDDTHDSTIDGGGPVPGPILAFTNLPYVPDAGGSCGAGTVNSPGVLDGATEAASHEYAETLTDQFPEVTPPGGWSTNKGSEIGDLCAYIAAPLPGAAYNLTLANGAVAVQGLWSNAANGGSGGCVQNAPIDRFTPTISSLSPTVAAVGGSVTITGTNLSGTTQVKFHGTPASVTSDGALAVVAVVPAGLTGGTVSVTTPDGTATSGQVFTVAAPTIKKFTGGGAGQQVTITGTNLSGATHVAFNGVAAVVVADSVATVIAVVPATATAGPITVQTPGGTASSANPFTPAPAIASISPGSGPVGSSVTVAGTGLAGATKVTIAGKKATVVTDTPTRIVMLVPPRATSGTVHVVTAGGTAISPTIFSVT